MEHDDEPKLCTHCGGLGEKNGEPCDRCGGTGFEPDLSTDED